MRRFKGEYAHFRFNKCPVYTHDSASAKFNTISQETDNSAPTWKRYRLLAMYGVHDVHSKSDDTLNKYSND